MGAQQLPAKIYTYHLHERAEGMQLKAFLSIEISIAIGLSRGTKEIRYQSRI